MRITVTAGSWAGRWVPGGESEIDLPVGTSIEDLLELLGIPAGEVGVVTSNGEAAPREAALAESDVIRIFPMVIGG